MKLKKGRYYLIKKCKCRSMMHNGLWAEYWGIYPREILERKKGHFFNIKSPGFDLVSCIDPDLLLGKQRAAPIMELMRYLELA